jgi:serine/threonine protein phosphatase PrpC
MEKLEHDFFCTLLEKLLVGYVQLILPTIFCRIKEEILQFDNEEKTDLVLPNLDDMNCEKDLFLCATKLFAEIKSEEIFKAMILKDEETIVQIAKGLTKEAQKLIWLIFLSPNEVFFDKTGQFFEGRGLMYVLRLPFLVRKELKRKFQETRESFWTEHKIVIQPAYMDILQEDVVTRLPQYEFEMLSIESSSNGLEYAMSDFATEFKIDKYHVYAVLDGAGKCPESEVPASFVAGRVLQSCFEQLLLETQNMIEVLQLLIQRLQDIVLSEGGGRKTTIAVLVLIQDTYYTIGVGDSYVLLRRKDGSIKSLVHTHNATNKDEVQRLSKLGISLNEQGTHFYFGEDRVCALSNMLGGKPKTGFFVPDVEAGRCDVGDQFVVATDGIDKISVERKSIFCYNYVREKKCEDDLAGYWIQIK